jgi:AmmeMemoRadiSam system protein A
MQANLSAQDQAKLLALAYDAIATAVNDSPPPSIKLESLSTALREMRASFVTLSLGGNLRGCIGTVEKCYPLAHDVMLRAAAAATRDPRFPPIRTDELDKIQIEVSILSDPLPLHYEDPTSLTSFLENEPVGVILHYGNKRATFLPQVWERVTSAEQFLSLLCRKAKLPDDFWKSGQLDFETYTIESFQLNP